MKNLILALVFVIPIAFYGGYRFGQSSNNHSVVIPLLESNKDNYISEARDNLNILFSIKNERTDLVEKVLLIKLTSFFRDPIYVNDTVNDDLKRLFQKALKYEHEYCKESCLGIDQAR